MNPRENERQEREQNPRESAIQPFRTADDRHTNSMDVIEGDVHFEPGDPRGVCCPDEGNRGPNQ